MEQKQQAIDEYYEETRAEKIQDRRMPLSVQIHLLTLRINQLLPRSVWIILGRVLLLWSFIIAGLWTSSWIGVWMMQHQWATPGFAGEIMQLCWFAMTTTSCGLCILTWSMPTLRKFFKWVAT